MTRFTGGCLCGDVRLMADGEPKRVGICHCMDCRKHHGAVFFAAAIFPQAAVTVTGETRSFKGRHFCPRCGSSLFAVNPLDATPSLQGGAADAAIQEQRLEAVGLIRDSVGGQGGGDDGIEIEVHLGAFDEPGLFTPTYELWTIRREPWLPTFATTDKWEKDRD